MRNIEQIKDFYSQIRKVGVEQIVNDCRQMRSEAMGTMILNLIPRLTKNPGLTQESSSVSHNRAASKAVP